MGDISHSRSVTLLPALFIYTISSGFCATALDEEYVSKYFFATSKGCSFFYLVIFLIWRSTSSHGLLSVIGITLQLYDWLAHPNLTFHFKLKLVSVSRSEY